MLSTEEQFLELKTDFSNIPSSISSKLGRNLHLKERHPIWIIKNIIYKYFKESLNVDFVIRDDLSQIQPVELNFDRLLIPKDHPSRRKSDTYYVNEKLVLRTHTSAHQIEMLSKHDNFLVTGDVYRKDEIDSCHYPIFHQMEGMGKVSDSEEPLEVLKKVLSGLIEYLFPDHEYRFNPDKFPFTDPSLEVEVKMGDKWIEILGGGITKEEIVKSTGKSGTWWAFGLGLERLAMILFQIPDIRCFWSQDPRFMSQFTKDSDKNKLKVVKFQPLSENLSTEIKDISFWISDEQLTETEDKKVIWNMENDFMDMIRDTCGDWIENVSLIDSFTNKAGRHSKCYRLKLLPIDTNIVDPGKFKSKCIELFSKVRDKLVSNEKYMIECRS